ncbi:MAG: ATP-dependent RecD-like DNA helicase [Deltaproteobacteria bacterium]|nr:ATP-dependent RecD-like DNA helicase [Deltaproteobacteria bacterium]
MTALEGCLDRVTFYNPENHYTIAKFRPRGAQNAITVVGFMPEPTAGEFLKLDGIWETHARYGQQLKIIRFEVLLPATTDGIRKYLKSGVIKGLGAKTISRLIRHFGDQTLVVIESAPEKLIDVKGIGKATAKQIAESWKSHHAVRCLMIFLQNHGISLAYSGRIFKEYGPSAVDILKDRPYQIACDIPGIGFYIADRIAQHQGAHSDDPQRIRACILYLLEQAAADGHMFMTGHETRRKCARLFDIDAESASAALRALSDEGQVVQEAMNVHGSDDGCDHNCDQALYLSGLHRMETGIARRLKAFLSVPVKPPDINQEQMTREILTRLAIQLSAEQQAVLEEILLHHIAIITGGPGTGKTTLIRSIAAICDRLRQKTILSAPTGRAARRLSEVARKKASTLHKLLGYNLEQNDFEKDEDDPLDVDVMIVDEASMMDAQLMFHLLKAVPVTATLILVGDVFQLPSVGPGNILSDLIQSGAIRTFELKEIFRQAEKSPIVVNAHRVRQGNLPILEKDRNSECLSEFYFIEQYQPETVVKTIVELCSRKIPERFGLDPVRDIQVLTPMHKGMVGTIQLNQVLQQALNPQSSPGAGIQFRPGDKVMHLKNNYAKEVFNGDIGVISEIDQSPEWSKRRLSVNYDERLVDYENEELEDLILAYAISVHKSQGSEYPAVVIPLMPQHHPLLQRNLLYTAITRGKKLVIIVGTRQALDTAIKNDKPRNRLSLLDQRLKNGANHS